MGEHKGQRLTGLWWWIDRWRKSSAFTDMSLAEQGAYRNLLDEAWLRGGVLPVDERVLARACGDAVAWKRVRAAVLARFRATPDGYRNETLDEVLDQTQRRIDKQRAYWDRKRGEDGHTPGNKAGNRAGNKPGNNAGNKPGNKPGSKPGDEPGNDTGNRPGNKPGSPDPDPDLGDKDQSPREARARGAGSRGGVGAGTFPGDHLAHLACGPVCFGSRMVTKFLGRFAGDRERLRVWAVAVCEREAVRLDAGGAPPAYGDDFAYWTAAYDAEFGERRKAAESEPEGLLVVKTCGCGQVLEGKVTKGRRVFPSCPNCEPAAASADVKVLA